MVSCMTKLREFVTEWVWIGCYDSTVSWLDSRSFWSNLWSFWLNSIDTRDSQTQIPNLDQVLTIFTHFSKSNYFLDLLYLPLQMVPFKESASLGPPRLNYFIPFYLGCKKTLRHKKQHQQWNRRFQPSFCHKLQFDNDSHTKMPSWKL